MARFGWWRDRGAILEDAWERRYRDVVKRSDPRDDAAKCSGLACPFLLLRPRRNHWIPLLVLNGTSEAKGNRLVTPEDRIKRTPDEVVISPAGTTVHLQGYGLVRVFRIDAPDGVAEYWATGDLAMDAGMRRHYAEVSFAIENYHRDLKRSCGVERCRVRSGRAQRNHIGLAVRAFLRLEWHFFTTGVSAFQAKLRPVRDAIRDGAIGRPTNGYIYWPTGRLGSNGTHFFDALQFMLDASPAAVEFPPVIAPGALAVSDPAQMLPRAAMRAAVGGACRLRGRRHRAGGLSPRP